MSEQLDPAALREEVLAAALRETWLRPPSCHAIVVLSAPPSLHIEDAWDREANAENVARVDLGVGLMSEFPDAVLCVNGDDEQVPVLIDLALTHGVDPDHIVPLSAGPRASANTKTQFESLNALIAMGLSDMILVTTSYHAPRVERTAHARLLVDARFCEVCVPRSIFPFDLEKVVEGETRRILEYAARGDIATTVPRARLLPVCE